MHRQTLVIHLSIWQTVPKKWTKWVCPFNENNWALFVAKDETQTFKGKPEFWNTFTHHCEADIVLILKTLYRHLEDLRNSRNRNFLNDQCMMLQSHTWLKSSFKNTTGSWQQTKSWLDIAKLTLNKLPLLGCSCSTKEKYPQLSKWLLKCSSTFQLYLSVESDFPHILQHTATDNAKAVKKIKLTGLKMAHMVNFCYVVCNDHIITISKSKQKYQYWNHPSAERWKFRPMCIHHRKFTVFFFSAKSTGDTDR